MNLQEAQTALTFFHQNRRRKTCSVNQHNVHRNDIPKLREIVKHHSPQLSQDQEEIVRQIMLHWQDPDYDVNANILTLSEIVQQPQVKFTLRAYALNHSHDIQDSDFVRRYPGTNTVRPEVIKLHQANFINAYVIPFVNALCQARELAFDGKHWFAQIRKDGPFKPVAPSEIPQKYLCAMFWYVISS